MKTFFGAFFGALVAIGISVVLVIQTFQPLLAVNVAVAEKILGAEEADKIAREAYLSSLPSYRPIPQNTEGN